MDNYNKCMKNNCSKSKLKKQLKTYECPYSWGCNNKLKKTLNKYECIAKKCNKSYVKNLENKLKEIKSKKLNKEQKEIVKKIESLYSKFTVKFFNINLYDKRKINFDGIIEAEKLMKKLI